MSSRIEQIIEEIEEYINNCKYQTLSNTKIIVNKEEIDELLTELRMKTPDEIKRYQKIISNQEAILANAKQKADEIVAKAQIHTTELINEHEIIQQAYAQAEEIVMAATAQAQGIVDNAVVDANSFRFGAIQYTDDMLKNLEGIIGHSMETTKARTESMLNALQSCYETINNNRNELMPPEERENPIEEDDPFQRTTIDAERQT
ncbi:ATPase [Lachnospiraceae bacterium ZAX-1]